MDEKGPYSCLKCSIDTDAEICPQCKTPTIDRSRVPDSIILVNRLVKRWRRGQSQPFLRVTFGGRETRV